MVVCYLFSTSIFWYFLFILFLSVETLKTFIFWISFLIFLVFPVIFILKDKTNIKYVFVFLSCFLVIFGLSFQKNEWEYNNFSLVCIDSCNKFSLNPLNAISEKELLNIWFRAAWALWIDNNKLNSFRNIILKTEEAVDIELPSQIPNAIFNNVGDEKYFLYKPENSKNRLVILLHWSAGSFMFYQKLFKLFMDDEGVTLVSPIFGWWNWNDERWTELVWNTYNDLLNKGIVNKDTEVVLMWVSNGGRWLTRLVSQDDDNIFSKVIFISGVIEKKITDGSGFKNNVKWKDVLVIHWEEDERVPFSYIEDFMVNSNLNNLDKLIFSEGNHFVLASEFDEIREKIEEFLNED